jgi:hypothetical protein
MLTIIKVTNSINSKEERTQSPDFLAKTLPVTGSCQKEAFGSFLVIVTFGIVMPSASLLSKKEE